MYKFEPILKTLVWGTESWVLSGVPGSESVVSEGPCAGRTLTHVYGSDFPLLIKFIDARKDLSIQVHPGEELAQKRHACHGKTEMWYAISAAPGASLISGFSRRITPEEYVELVSRDEITSVLAKHSVQPGDVFFLPAGRVHAIGAGCYLAEIQQTSDITYRIYDYNRPGLDGKPRQLHTQEAKDAIDYGVYPDYRTHYEPKKDIEVTLVDCPYFRTCLLDLDAPFSRGFDERSDFVALVCMEGSCTVRTDKGCAGLNAGETLLLLQSDGKFTVEPQGKAKLLSAER